MQRTLETFVIKWRSTKKDDDVMLPTILIKILLVILFIYDVIYVPEINNI